ncbi:MAG: AAA family ATPase [Pseudomonadota bacterium]
MQRISIIGGPGSGKTTLARALGERLGLPFFHLDNLFWRPGWVEGDRKELAAKVREITKGDAWVIEGNYSVTWPDRIARSDTLIHLDVGTPLRFWRVLVRGLRHYGQVRPDFAEGCREQLDPAFLRFVLAYRKRPRDRALALLRDAPDHLACYRLQGPAAARAFLASVSGGTQGRPSDRPATPLPGRC